MMTWVGFKEKHHTHKNISAGIWSLWHWLTHSHVKEEEANGSGNLEKKERYENWDCTSYDEMATW